MSRHIPVGTRVRFSPDALRTFRRADGVDRKEHTIKRNLAFGDCVLDNGAIWSSSWLDEAGPESPDKES